jgi:dihydrofolate reductase
MTISLIACIDKSRAIGNSGTLLTKPPLDFEHFKNLTVGHYCIFGRKTFEEIGKPLKNRHNIVLSSKGKEGLPSGIFTYPSLEKIMTEYHQYAKNNIELFICGGENVYKEFLPYADYIHLTIVDHIFPKSDRYFPEFTIEEWEVESNVKNEATEDYPYDYYFVTYKKRLK